MHFSVFRSIVQLAYDEEGSFGIGWDFNIDVSKIEIPAIGYYKLVLLDGSNTTFKDYENDGFGVPERTQH